MGGGGEPGERRDDEETQEQRIERERHEAGDEERDSADGPGYTARPAGGEPEEDDAPRPPRDR
jgi:hypothetical protein